MFEEVCCLIYTRPFIADDFAICYQLPVFYSKSTYISEEYAKSYYASCISEGFID